MCPDLPPSKLCRLPRLQHIRIQVVKCGGERLLSLDPIRTLTESLFILSSFAFLQVFDLRRHPSDGNHPFRPSLPFKPETRRDEMLSQLYSSPPLSPGTCNPTPRDLRSRRSAGIPRSNLPLTLNPRSQAQGLRTRLPGTRVSHPVIGNLSSQMNDKLRSTRSNWISEQRYWMKSSVWEYSYVLWKISIGLVIRCLVIKVDFWRKYPRAEWFSNHPLEKVDIQ